MKSSNPSMEKHSRFLSGSLTTNCGLLGRMVEFGAGGPGGSRLSSGLAGDCPGLPGGTSGSNSGMTGGTSSSNSGMTGLSLGLAQKHSMREVSAQNINSRALE